MERSPIPSLFAVIIGIDIYKDNTIANLQGAVKDAKDFKLLLKEMYGVPERRIVKLINQEATREKILRALESLVNRPEIDKNDPIVIYYAGHGSEIETESAGKMQMLLPQDFVRNGSLNRQGQGITDRSLCHLLTKIAEKKSDNITVIFDCCNSGSGTRKAELFGFSIRGLDLPSSYTIPPDILAQELAPEREGYHLRSSMSKTAGYSSHILLAACRSNQTAKESKEGGAFTSRLIALLRQGGMNRPSNANIILQIEIPEDYNQNPQCEGMNKTRVLFDTKVAAHRVYNVQASGTYPAELTLKAGEAHGITIDAEFAIYSDQRLTRFLGSMKAAEAVNPFSTVLQGAPLLPVPQKAFALLTCYGRGQDLRLHVQPCKKFSNVFKLLYEEMQQSPNNIYRRSFSLVNDPSNEECDLALYLRDDGYVEFCIKNKFCQRYELATMPVDNVSPNDSLYMSSILHSAADFYRNLRHHESSTDSSLLDHIDVECLRVAPTGRRTKNLQEIYQVADPTNLNTNGRIKIDVNEKTQYGFTIHSRLAVGVFAALFYFDPHELSIEDYYAPSTAAKGATDFCIPPQGHLTIGYGENAISAFPWKYELPNKATFDVGFLKLYISTEGDVDFQSIPQKTPFETGPGRGSRRIPAKPQYYWHSRIIPIIQRRGT
ncbi:hypothetical protein V5O48_014182 [Marasmius crinis-equi]|uniref:Peptidase C14 caspase domain-containing protein n=1 Tax=Marasmius crinis-equi TaxID=585013 RepID=A0ABR3EY15_9AGAR